MTNNILLIFRNPCLMPAAVGWATAQIIKVLLNLLLLRKLDVTRFVGAGGMPSAHSAFVTALTVSMGLNYGFDSAFFAISAALAMVVMYDAAGVRPGDRRPASTASYATSEKNPPDIRTLKNNCASCSAIHRWKWLQARCWASSSPFSGRFDCIKFRNMLYYAL